MKKWTPRHSATRQSPSERQTRYCLRHSGQSTIQMPSSGHHRHRLLYAYIIARGMLVATLITSSSSFFVHTASLGHAPTMVILTFDDQLVDGRIAGLLTRDYQWLQGAHIAYQMPLGSHEGASCLQQKSVAATQTNQDTKAADTIDTPPYLKRKLMRHDGMAGSSFMGLLGS